MLWRVTITRDMKGSPWQDAERGRLTEGGNFVPPLSPAPDYLLKLAALLLLYPKTYDRHCKPSMLH